MLNWNLWFTDQKKNRVEQEWHLGRVTDRKNKAALWNNCQQLLNIVYEYLDAN